MPQIHDKGEHCGDKADLYEVAIDCENICAGEVDSWWYCAACRHLIVKLLKDNGYLKG